MFADLEFQERRVYSQNGEDGVIEALFERLGLTNKFFVELGCGDGLECNGAYLLEKGWNGLMIDYPGVSANPLAKIHSNFITAENINWLLEKYNVPQGFDLLTIDLDGNDFWVWQQIVHRPRVVVVEYNAAVPPDQRRVIVYDPNFEWNGTDYFGASLAALAELARRKGYELVYCERAGVNSFFVAEECLPADYKPRPIEKIYRRPNYGYVGGHNPHENTRMMIDPFYEAEPQVAPNVRTVGR